MVIAARKALFLGIRVCGVVQQILRSEKGSYRGFADHLVSVGFVCVRDRTPFVGTRVYVSKCEGAML